MINTKLNIAICDDDKNTLGIISNTIQFIFQNNKILTEIYTYNSPISLKNDLDKISFNLVLLDIEMPGIDGIQLGKIIKDKHHFVQIIYISNREDRVFETFDTLPFGFIRKSNFLADINKVVNLYIESLKNDVPDSITVSNNGNATTVAINDIVYIESQAHYQVIHTVNNQCLNMQTSMESLMDTFKDQGFINCFRGILVNYRHIYSIDKDKVILINKEEIPMSRRKANETKEEYLKLIKRNSKLIV